MKRGTHFIVLVALVSAFSINAQSRSVMSQNKEVVRKIYEECINRGKLDRLDEFVSDTYQGGVAAFRANVADLRTGFPDVHFTLEDVIAEGDRVVVRWRWEATHDGTFRGVAPTHKRIRNSGIAIYRLRDQKVLENWLETDRLGVLQQMGAPVR